MLQKFLINTNANLLIVNLFLIGRLCLIITNVYNKRSRYLLQCKITNVHFFKKKKEKQKVNCKQW